MNTFRFILCSLAMLGSAVACQTAPTTAAVPTTQSLPPTEAPLPTVENTPLPTQAAIPQIGETVVSEKWELVLIGASLLERGVKDAEINAEALPAEGARFVSLGFKVKPLASAVVMSTQNIMIKDENAQKWGAYYLGVTEAAQEIDPLQIEVKRFFVALGEEIDLSMEKYVHMIFQVPSASIGQQVFLCFDDVPPVAFIVE